MTRTISSLTIAFAVALAALASPAEAQTKRAGDTFYLKFGAGFSDYTGDFDTSPLSFDEFSEGTGFPYAWSGEVGYQTSPQFAIGLAYLAGRYPLVLNDAPGTDPDRFTAQLLGRYTFGAQNWTVAPYLDLGANASFTGTDSGFGPTVGLGLDIVLNDFASFYVESRSNLTFPDDAMDGVEGGTSFDALSQLLGVGFKLNFARATTAPRIIALDGPSEVQAGESATFTATVNEDEATRPLQYQWDFGDGSTGSGLTATHTFNEPGTYTVSFTASNRAGEASESLSVNVTYRPAQITSINATPNPADEGETVQFESNVQGDSPIDYEWTFGDGSTASGSSPTHTYDEPGEYTVELTASNEGGSDSRTLTMQVERVLPEICTTVSELNSAYFEPNSSTLTDEAEQSLQENADILSQCPNLDVRIEGFAAPGERNAQSLSEDRAQAVADYYEENGVESGRMTVSGEGQVEGVTSKKGGTREYRRVDSIPQRQGGDM